MTPPPPNSKPRLLVVDDEYWGCRTLKALFARAFDVDTALSVAEARGKLLLDSYDAAIIDYHMPGENGMALIDILQAFLPKERLFLCTADNSLEGQIEHRYTYLGKPYDPKQLVTDITATVVAAKQSIAAQAASRTPPIEVSHEAADVASPSKSIATVTEILSQEQPEQIAPKV